jgi:hypothetical protein
MIINQINTAIGKLTFATSALATAAKTPVCVPKTQTRT